MFGAVETDLRVGSSFRLLWRTTLFLGILANTIKTSQRCVKNFLKLFLLTSYVFKSSLLRASGPKSSKIGDPANLVYVERRKWPFFLTPRQKMRFPNDQEVPRRHENIFRGPKKIFTRSEICGNMCCFLF